MPAQDGATKLPESVKRDAVAVFEQFYAEEISFDAAIRQARKLSRVGWYRSLLDDLQIEYDPDLPRLPHAPGDAWHLQQTQVAHDAARRTICFLQAGRFYDNGEPAWVYYLNRVLVIVFVFSILAGGGILLSQKRFGLGDGLQPLVQVFGITALLWFVPVAISYFIELANAGVHIFRVRVLRQDLRGQLDQDIWPYLKREDYEADLAEAGSSVTNSA